MSSYISVMFQYFLKMCLRTTRRTNKRHIPGPAPDARHQHRRAGRRTRTFPALSDSWAPGAGPACALRFGQALAHAAHPARSCRRDSTCSGGRPLAAEVPHAGPGTDSSPRPASPPAEVTAPGAPAPSAPARSGSSSALPLLPLACSVSHPLFPPRLLPVLQLSSRTCPALLRFRLTPSPSARLRPLRKTPASASGASRLRHRRVPQTRWTPPWKVGRPRPRPCSGVLGGPASPPSRRSSGRAAGPGRRVRGASPRSGSAVTAAGPAPGSFAAEQPARGPLLILKHFDYLKEKPHIP